MGSIPDSAQSGAAAKAALPNIIDIRSDAAGIELKQMIKAGLKPTDGEEKTLPTLLLYDDEGLKLFERITYLKEYYLTGDEIEVLETHAKSIAQRIPNESMLVELGSGYVQATVKAYFSLASLTGRSIVTFVRSRYCSTLWRKRARMCPTLLWT